MTYGICKIGKKAYNEGIIDDIIWLRRKFNIADTMTKLVILSEFFEALYQTNLHSEKEESVNRTILTPKNENKKSEFETFHNKIQINWTTPGTTCLSYRIALYSCILSTFLAN